MAEKYPKYQPGTTTGTSFVSPGATVYQPAPTSMTSARGVYQPAPTSAKSARSALEQVVSEYTSRGEGLAGQLPSQVQERALAGRQAPAAQQEGDGFNLQDILDQMYQTVGGPNAALIAQYQAQKQQLQQNYSQNKADANNLYGELSSDIEEYGAGLQERYTTSIGEMGAAQTTRQEELAALQAQRDADRAKVAASLGIAAEDVQTPQSTALQEIAGLSSAAASNWENLFKANQLLAEGSTKRQLTGAKATQADQLLAMKRYLDAQSMAIDSQIAAERMKTPTQELTDFGKFVQPAMFGEQLRQLQGIAPGIFGAGEQPAMSSFGEKVAGAQQYFQEIGKNYNPTQIQGMIDKINEYMNAVGQYGVPGAIGRVGALTSDETVLAEILGFNPPRS